MGTGSEMQKEQNTEETMLGWARNRPGGLIH